MHEGTIEALVATPPPIVRPVEATLVAHRGAQRMSRAELALLPLPEATRTHRPVPHVEVVNALVETLGFRGFQVTREEYAAHPDGGKMFGVLQIDHGYLGCHFAIGIRNSNDKSLRLGITIGYRVFVCDNLMFNGDFTPVLAKHSASLNLIDLVSIGVDRMQRGFNPLEKQIKAWQENPLADLDARTIIYDAFVNGKLKAPKKLIFDVHDAYFNPQLEAFRARSYWSLANAFTTAIKNLTPINHYQAAAKVGKYLTDYF